MNSLSKTMLLVVVAFFAVSCSSNNTIYLSDEYQKNSINSSFALLPLKNVWVPDAVIAPLNGTSKEYLYLALESSFRSTTTSQVDIIDREIEFPAGSFTRKKLDSDNLSIEVSLPPDELLNLFPERYVYFFEGYGFRVMEKSTPGSSYAGNEASVFKVLFFETEFYLFDKETKEIISWGQVGDQVQIVDSPEYNHYLELMDKVSRKIVSRSPFQMTKP